MKSINPGENLKLSGSELNISISISKPASFKGELDPSAFLLTKSGKVRSDADFLFYGQPNTPDNSIVADSAGGFKIDLNKIPEEVAKIALTLVIDGESNFGDLDSLSLKLDGECQAEYPTTDRSEKALILAHVYRHNGTWKFKSVNAGFNGGLGPLATSFGVDIADDEAEQSPPKKQITTEEKIKIRLQKDAPALINLAKPIAINLKKNGIEDEQARVVLVLDASGSMTQQYKKGHVQSVLERIVPLSILFDDDGQLELWAFAKYCKKYENAHAGNYEGYIDRNINPKFKKGGFFGFQEIFSGLGGINNEKDVMREVIDWCGKDKRPVYVVFISDGGVTDNRAITNLIKKSTKLPIFWQFVGLGGNNYGILENLDTLSGRDIDNAGFFNIDDFNKISDDNLYDKLLKEYPLWLKEARRMGIAS